MEISLSSSSEMHEDGQRYIQMTVEDNGNGMTEGEQLALALVRGFC